MTRPKAKASVRRRSPSRRWRPRVIVPRPVAAAPVVDEWALMVEHLRARLRGSLISTGGRPGLRDAMRRPKVPVSREDWKICVELASRLKDESMSPTPGQVASVLITDMLDLIDDEEARAHATPTP